MCEMGLTENEVLHMPIGKFLQYRHCLYRRMDIRTHWSTSMSEVGVSPVMSLAQIREEWKQKQQEVDSEDLA